MNFIKVQTTSITFIALNTDVSQTINAMPIGSEVTDYFCIAVGFCKVFLTQRGKSLSAGEDNGGRVISVHFIHFCFFAVSHSSKL